METGRAVCRRQLVTDGTRAAAAGKTAALFVNGNPRPSCMDLIKELRIAETQLLYFSSSLR